VINHPERETIDQVFFQYKKSFQIQVREEAPLEPAQNRPQWQSSKPATHKEAEGRLKDLEKMPYREIFSPKNETRLNESLNDFFASFHKTFSPNAKHPYTAVYTIKAADGFKRGFKAHFDPDKNGHGGVYISITDLTLPSNFWTHTVPDETKTLLNAVNSKLLKRGSSSRSTSTTSTSQSTLVPNTGTHSPNRKLSGLESPASWSWERQRSLTT
jgi:hypothetical protein